MTKLITGLTTVILALMLAAPTVGCQQKDKDKENKKALDVQVDTGKVKVKVEGSKKPDEKGGRLDVQVERHSAPESRDREK